MNYLYYKWFKMFEIILKMSNKKTISLIFSKSLSWYLKNNPIYQVF